jgi:hypothetical protein
LINLYDNINFQILRRSAQLLEAVNSELNPEPYLLICRQLSFELGEIYLTMVDLKQQKLKARQD